MHPFPSYTIIDVFTDGCLNIDFIDTSSDKGYILVVVCTFTRWVELFATENAKAGTTANCLLMRFQPHLWGQTDQTFSPDISANIEIQDNLT